MLLDWPYPQKEAMKYHIIAIIDWCIPWKDEAVVCLSHSSKVMCMVLGHNKHLLWCLVIICVHATWASSSNSSSTSLPWSEIRTDPKIVT